MWIILGKHVITVLIGINVTNKMSSYKVLSTKAISKPILQSNSHSLMTIKQILTHWGRDEIAAISQTAISFLNENVWIALKISLKFVFKVWIDNIPALIQIMSWRRPGNKQLSETMKQDIVLTLFILTVKIRYLTNCWTTQFIAVVVWTSAVILAITPQWLH